MKNTIVIVDDHILIAKALTSIIATFNDFEVLYECENGKELIEKFNSKNALPKIVLLDVSMPIMNGFETCAWLQNNYPDVIVIALSMQDDDDSVIKMIKSGAKGYLLKNTNPKTLENALIRVVNDGYYYPEWASKIVFDSLNKKETSVSFKITDREKEFLKYSVSEMNYKDIADKMCCSPRTVESYRDSLFEKLELKTRVGLAIFAIKNGFDKS